MVSRTAFLVCMLLVSFVADSATLFHCCRSRANPGPEQPLEAWRGPLDCMEPAVFCEWRFQPFRHLISKRSLRKCASSLIPNNLTCSLSLTRLTMDLAHSPATGNTSRLVCYLNYFTLLLSSIVAHIKNTANSLQV